MRAADLRRGRRRRGKLPGGADLGGDGEEDLQHDRHSQGRGDGLTRRWCYTEYIGVAASAFSKPAPYTSLRWSDDVWARLAVFTSKIAPSFVCDDVHWRKEEVSGKGELGGGRG